MYWISPHITHYVHHLVVAVVLLLSSAATVHASSFQLSSLKTEYLETPLGVDKTEPRVSWQIIPSNENDDRGIYQKSYQLEISKSHAFVDTPVWDCSNGIVVSSNSHLIPLKCQGLTLKSDTNYYWRVTVTLNDDSSSTASAISTFRTGLLFPMKDWSPASWIHAGDFQKNLFRKEFNIPTTTQNINYATLYISGIGYYEVYINGNKVGNHILDPGWTNYHKRIWYVTYDVTKMLLLSSTTRNSIGIQLGNGWFSCGIQPPGTNQPACETNYPPQVIMMLNINGKTILSTSDDNWKVSNGPILYNSLYNGEIYDGRIEEELEGWTNIGYDDSKWDNASDASSSPASNISLLSSQLFEPIRHISTRPPISMTLPSPNIQVFDFGQNQAAVVHVKNLVNCKRGTNVTLRHAEVLIHPPYGPKDGNIYVDNLRSAKATDIYICRGSSSETESYIPTFTQHGFRYVEITGLDYPLNEEDLEAVELHTDVSQTSSILFSNPLLNQIQHLVMWSLKTNLMSVQTDCDQRDERRGWLGDAAMTAEAAVYNYGMESFYTHWLEQIVDEQDDDDGSIPNFVPALGTSHGAPNWESAFPGILWVMLMYYGDYDIITKHHNALVKYYGYLELNYNQTNGNLTNFTTGFGDWVPPPPSKKADGHLTGSFAFVHDLQLMIDIFTYSKHSKAPDMVKRISTLLQKVSNEYHEAFYDKDKGYYLSGLQTEQALPLFLGVVPESIQPKVVSYLLHDIQVTQSNHTTCGIVGIKYLMEVLSILGHSNVALDLALQTTYPSWGYMLHGQHETATTLWELWNSDVAPKGMNSRNHHMFGTVSSWFYKYVVGIQPMKPGYTQMKIHPTIVNHANLTHVQAKVVTPHGDVYSFWKREEKEVNENDGEKMMTVVLTHKVTLPPGTRSILVIPISLEATSSKSSNHYHRHYEQDKNKQKNNTMLMMRRASTSNNIRSFVASTTTATITEGGVIVWNNGHFVPGVKGVLNATMSNAKNCDNCVELELTNGRFLFETTIMQQQQSPFSQE